MFPDPLSDSEIDLVLKPLLAQCDGRGRRHIIALAAAPVLEATNPDTVDTIRAAFWETAQAIR